ncbi:MAG TPA: MmgE/PrpD family protein [Spirochaetota bacterium]|nr:MmgE/PrpD family protein [Spirochaetota bacterium]HPV97753.1 MmgE/PrpD family protein [Spirochaetota bacterium]
MDHTRKLAHFCSKLSFDSLPGEVVEKAKLCVLDYISNIYGSLELDAVKAVVEYVKSLDGPKAATALGCGFKTGLQNAAFVNGTTAEAIEAQDGLRFGGNHPVSAVLPVAIALAEKLKLGGRALIEAVVAGYEAADRPAAAMHPWHTLSGFLPTGTCGTFGAAAAAAKLMGLNEEGMLNAIGNAGYVLPLSMAEQLMGGYTIKIVQGGQAASAGIMAAGLASKGITGCPEVLEGSALKGGFTQITSRADPNLDKLSDGLGEHYSIMDIYFKPYSACRHTHGAAQATLKLIREHGFGAGEIESITVHTYGVAELAVGKGVPDGGSFVSAQFSLPYVVAACILDGDLGPGQLTERRIADSAVIDLTKRVSVKLDEELNKAYPEKTSSRVEISLKDGRELAWQTDIPKGDPRDPMEADDLAEKLSRFAGGRKPERLEKIIGMVMELEKLRDVGELASII